MFKKLKDKLAEEVKSSPQRIQLFAQAAQAAVTSASSSISDITNSDLFSIGDNDAHQSRQTRPQSSPSTQNNMFQDVSLMQSPAESADFSSEIADSQRQRKLSNSSFASDVSFRLPSYETPSMYHLQSDMEVSASEADDRGFSGGPATLDRVTKEQLYAAYKRTQERYKKYRTQYGDLARHYKLLERENAKARSVLVETQDKALRRISELKEQCTLEQSAKAHLEKALRVEIEEKCMKIEALSTKVQLLQSNIPSDVESKTDNFSKPHNENEVHLINLDTESKQPNEDSGTDVTLLNNKIEKMEQLLNKYKESLKSSKEKNSQITMEVQILSKELESKNKQIEDSKTLEEQLKEANTKIQDLNNSNEELQNQINTFDFTKIKELSTFELDLQKANEEIAELRGKIEVFTKREEEYAISLAENKLSIHKELESKEAEIKSLKDKLSSSKREIQSLQIVVDDYKKNISMLEEENIKLKNDCIEVNSLKSKISEMDTNMQEMSKKTQSLEQMKQKADEEYKCLQLQLNQETAEKLAMIDRNVYLESKNTQLTEENLKKSTKISSLESDLQLCANNKDLENEYLYNLTLKETEKNQMFEEMNTWKDKCAKLEFEIQEEREELAKLQTEIEKLLNNHELIQAQNIEYRSKLSNLSTECAELKENALNYKSSSSMNLNKTLNQLKELRQCLRVTSEETKSNLELNQEMLSSATEDINSVIRNAVQDLFKDIELYKAKYENLKTTYDSLMTEMVTNNTRQSEASSEIDTLLKENKNLTDKIHENESLNDKLEKISCELECASEKNKSLDSENNELNKKLKNLNENYQHLQNKLENEEYQHSAAAQKLTNFAMEMERLKQHHENILVEVKRTHDDLLRKKQEDMTEKLDKISCEFECTSEKNKLLNSENSELNKRLKDLEETSQHLRNELENEKLEHSVSDQKLKNVDMEMERLKQHHENIFVEVKTTHDDLLRKKEEEIEKLCKQNQQHSYTLEQLRHVNIEKDESKNNIQVLENNNLHLTSVIEKLSKELKIASEQVSELNNEIAIREEAIEKSKQIQISLEKEIAEYLMSRDTVSEYEIEKQDLTGKLKSAENKNQLLNEELEELKRQQKIANNHIEEINATLTSKSKQCDADQLRINKLEEHIRTLTQENFTLQTQTANFASNIKELESEIDGIKISHTEIEIEKDNLTRIIEKLESEQTKHSMILKEDKNIQTEMDDDTIDTSVEASAILENKWVMEHKQAAMSTTASLNLKKENLEDMYEQYSILKINYDSLKDENRRLQSDIEGLQSYLTKISKENSVLNDKLRELIATSEHSTDNEQLSSDVKELQSEIQVSKEKLNDLQRENSFLIEENLELKDQLQSQNYSKPEDNTVVSPNKKDIDIIKLKYNDLLQTNSQLEKHNVELDQVNKSVSGNMQQVLDKNERLKLTNEKLERRLDEALVSLRHLHSLQENTELEYLRNILYEYLTGSGTHSVTLAKVLAAIVKFDDGQTQMVLQKEKERQGFLRQLGII